jgi:dihydrodipicolinate synthase/N-acetylneuraminate lyase
MNKFHGTGVAMITPFKSDGSVDHTALKAVIDAANMASNPAGLNPRKKK